MTPDGADLPDPPSADPSAYDAWLAGLPRTTRARVRALCRSHPVEYEAPCAGIGPLHIPIAPDVLPKAGESGLTHEEWEAGLSKPQLAYMLRQCVPHGEMGGEPSDLCQYGTPLLVAFDRAPVRYTQGTRFALAPGAPRALDWPTVATPWLALDRDADGAITNGAELFGDHTPLAAGGVARDGFEALADLDANGDGVIDPRDPAFRRLVLWADRDRDGRSTPDELTPIAGVIDAIPTTARDTPRCDSRGNCERQRVTIRWLDAGRAPHVGAVIDVYLLER